MLRAYTAHILKIVLLKSFPVTFIVPTYLGIHAKVEILLLQNYQSISKIQFQMASGQNIGLVVRNLTHLPSNESCGSGGRDCRYYMHLCFSFSEKLDCSIFTLTTLTWLVRPGDSKIIKLYQYVARNTVNPLRVGISKWKRVSWTS